MNSSDIYFDNNATTMVAPEVIDAMLPFLREQWGNPSSIHRFGGKVRRHVENARSQVAMLIGASPEEIYFTSCGSESDNMALKGFFAIHGTQTRIITSSVEHPAVRNTARYLKERGASLFELEVDKDGCISAEVFDELPIDEHTIVSLMWANNETGVIFPINEIASKVKAHGGTMHTDAVQAAGKISLDCAKTPVDFLALSGHKLHAPKGIGVLYIRKGTPCEPLLHGGHQESGMRAGTENVPYCVGLGVACELARQHHHEEVTRVRELRDRLENGLLSSCAGAKLNGHHLYRLPNTTNISFENIEGEAILLHLDEHGIAASSGSACTTGSLEPSHVMMAMGIPYTFAHSSTRFSLSRYTTGNDVDRVLEVMPGIVEKLRSISPFVERGKVASKDLCKGIAALKKKMNAVVLAHTYQPGPVQECADYVGDSYGLSIEATRTNASTIIFCGVRFMAETAAILNPASRVILPEPLAGCPMADMITPQELIALKAKYPDHLVMCYVNSTAEIKALSDVCCTSSNAETIARQLPADRGIIFVPDRHLGSYVQEKTGRSMVLWNGYCQVHVRITPGLLTAARKAHPEALLLIHPEAPHESRILADAVLSTGGMLSHVAVSEKKEFIIATENGLLYTLQKNNPDKRFYPVSDDIICPNMKRCSLESVRAALSGSGGEVVTVEKTVAQKALLSLEKMLELSRRG